MPARGRVSEFGRMVVILGRNELQDSFIGGGEQVFGFDEFAGLDDLRHAFLQDLIADQIEVAGRHEQFFGVKFHAFRTAEILFEDGQKVFERGILGR